MNRPSRVEITESSPRDGLQSLGVFISTEAKIGLIDELALAGLTSFDAVSFVSPAAVPQMADGTEVVAGVARDGIRLNGLVPNLRGLEAALAAGVDGIGVLAAASDTFSLRNVKTDVAGAMERIRGILAEVPEGVGVRGYVSTATHCPYEGPTDPRRVAELAARLVEWGCAEVFLGETLGRGPAGDVEALLDAVLDAVPVDLLGVHFHDTYGQALANLMVSLDAGVARLDSSAGGLGGCPYAPGAAGNVATEDVMWLLTGLGIDHDGDIGAVAGAAARFCADWKLPYQSRAGRALLAADKETD